MNKVHPTAIVGRGAYLGDNNVIGPYCIIKDGTEIGDNNHFEAYTSIGTMPEHKEAIRTGKCYPVRIGSNNIFREYVTVNAGAFSNTIIRDNNFFLRGSHVGHDCIILDNNTISCNVLIGGHSKIFNNCNLGLGAIIHQFSSIRSFAMLGMGTIVTKGSLIEAGKIYVGNPARFLKVNTIGLERAGVNINDIKDIIE